jgi:hypothetical protein
MLNTFFHRLILLIYQYDMHMRVRLLITALPNVFLINAIPFYNISINMYNNIDFHYVDNFIIFIDLGFHSNDGWSKIPKIKRCVTLRICISVALWWVYVL